MHTARELRPDAVVLDGMLPDLDGLEALQDSVQDRVADIAAGGDDYVTTPFSLEEVVARLTGMLRRAEAAPGRRPGFGLPSRGA